MFKITKYNNLDDDKITIKNKISIGENASNIFLRYNKKEFVIQGPIMIAPFGVSQFGQNKYIDLSFVNIENDESIKKFHDAVSLINQFVLKHMRYKEKYYKKDFVNSIKKSDGIYPKRIRLSLDKACKVYNNYKQEIDIKQIKSRALLKTLINISHVWMNNGKFGIFWNILQIKHYGKLVLTEYEFIEDENPQILKIPVINETVIPRNSIPLPPPLPQVKQDLMKEKYIKYFKMLEMGVNSDAVKQKLVMDGHDPNIIDNPSCDTVCPKKNNKETTSLPSIKDKVNLLSELKSGIKLKNVIRILKPKSKINLKKKSENLTVPSLWEVRNCLNNLKKTNINLLK
jgi:hypothetical protein